MADTSRAATRIPSFFFAQPRGDSSVSSGLSELANVLNPEGRGPVAAFIRKREEKAELAVDAAFVRDAALNEKKFFEENPHLTGLGDFVPALIQNRHGTADANRLGAELKSRRDSDPEKYADIDESNRLVEDAARAYGEANIGNDERVSAFSQAFEPHRTELMNASATDQAAKVRREAKLAISSMVSSSWETYVAYDGEGDPAAFINDIKAQLVMGDVIGPAGLLGSQETIVQTLQDLGRRPEFAEYADELIEAVRDSSLVTDPALDTSLTTLVNQIETKSGQDAEKALRIEKREKERATAELKLQLVGEAAAGGITPETRAQALKIEGGVDALAQVDARIAQGVFEESRLLPEQHSQLIEALYRVDDPTGAANLVSALVADMTVAEQQHYSSLYHQRYSPNGALRTPEASAGASDIANYVRNEIGDPEIGDVISQTYYETLRGTNGDAEAVRSAKQAARAAGDEADKRATEASLDRKNRAQAKRAEIAQLKLQVREAYANLQDAHEVAIQSRAFLPVPPDDPKYREELTYAIRKDIATVEHGGFFDKLFAGTTPEAREYDTLRTELRKQERELDELDRLPSAVDLGLEIF